MAEKSQTTTSSETLSPAARLFHAPKFNCHIIGIIGCRTSVNPTVIKEGLKHTLINHPRFCSKLVINEGIRGELKWEQTTVNIEDHVIVPQLDQSIENPDKFVEDYISYMTTMPVDFSKPLWELHLLNIKTSDAESTGVFRLHHSLGDGASIISLLLACTRKTSDPDALPTVPNHKPRDSTTRFLVRIWTALMLVWNTIMDLLVFVATFLFLEDTKNPLKHNRVDDDEQQAIGRRIVHRTVSLDDIKLVKRELNMTINDVILGLTQAGLTRYLNRSYAGGLPKKMRLRAAVLVNLRPTTGIQELASMMAKESDVKWGNRIGYVLVPFKIRVMEDPLDYVKVAKATIDRKKVSMEAICTYLIAKCITAVLGFKALTVHFQSYVNRMTIVVAVNPKVVSDPHKLCEDIEESLLLLKDTIINKNSMNMV